MKSLLISPVKTEHLSIPNTKVYPKEVQFRQVSLYYVQMLFIVRFKQDSGLSRVRSREVLLYLIKAMNCSMETD
jgi:hypothetical protein